MGKSHPIDLRGQCEKKRCDEWRSPGTRGLPVESVMGRFAHRHLIFTPLWSYSEMMVFTASLRAHFPTAAGRRDNPAAGIEASGTLLTCRLPGPRWLCCAGLCWLCRAAYLSTAGHQQSHHRAGQHGPESAGSSSLWICCKHCILPSFGQCSRNITMQRSPRLKSTELVSRHRMVSLKARAIYGPNENSALYSPCRPRSQRLEESSILGFLLQVALLFLFF